MYIYIYIYIYSIQYVVINNNTSSKNNFLFRVVVLAQFRLHCCGPTCRSFRSDSGQALIGFRAEGSGFRV